MDSFLFVCIRLERRKMRKCLQMPLLLFEFRQNRNESNEIGVHFSCGSLWFSTILNFIGLHGKCVWRPICQRWSCHGIFSIHSFFSPWICFDLGFDYAQWQHCIKWESRCKSIFVDSRGNTVRPQQIVCFNQINPCAILPIVHMMATNHIIRVSNTIHVSESVRKPNSKESYQLSRTIQFDFPLRQFGWRLFQNSLFKL